MVSYENNAPFRIRVLPVRGAASWKCGGKQRRTVVKLFKGPADFCVMPEKQGLLVVVPDLVKSELRLVHLK